MTKLLIKYNNNYICEQNHNEITFIHIPMYHPKGDYFSNISVFITLLSNGYLNYDYSSSVYLLDYEWSDLFEKYFIPEYLTQVDEDTYIYDLDQLLLEEPEHQHHYQEILSKLPINLIQMNSQDLKNIDTEQPFNEEIPYTWNYQTTHINKELELLIQKRHSPSTSKDVLLMYSGGKDSTLTAIRLKNESYNIHFVHFDNGYMRDSDKPYLTYKKTFSQIEGYHFDFENSGISIKQLFEEYFSKWQISSSEEIKSNGTLTSEIRCLSCRMAMYTKAIMIAKEKGYKYIAEGARISQKFMLEQLPMIERLKKLASAYGIELLFPVLYLEDDQEEINELLSNGFSAKSWESKCIIGSSSKDKTKEDETAILTYYDSHLKPQMLKKIK